jgi:hypothetical protein
VAVAGRLGVLLVTLHATFIDEGRQAEHPPDPNFPLGIGVDCTAGRPGCAVALRYPALGIGKWFIRCDACGTNALVSAAGRSDDPHTVRLPCKPQGTA